MMNDLMGEDDYGEEEEGYGDEEDDTQFTKSSKKKVPEEEFDFMWEWE